MKSQKLNKTLIVSYIVAFLLPIIVLFGLFNRTSASDSKGYSIEQYKGHLIIAADNTALFTQEIVYHYEDDFNGQYVTLGEAGDLPFNFEVEADQVTYEVFKNNQQVIEPTVEMERLSDGHRLKIFNSVDDGDQVRIVVHWPIKSPLFSYQDIAELNWVPISDWDVPLEHVNLRVTLPQEYSGEVFAHTGYFGVEPQVNVQSSSYEIIMDNLPAGRKVELHAYWDRSLLSQIADSEIIPEVRKSQVVKTEQNIKRNTQIARQLVFWYVPAISILILVVVLIQLILKKRELEPLSQMMASARLYEPPGDESPLHLAAQVYSVELKEANPVEPTNTTLKFEHMIQASLMDLIDRGNLSLDDTGEEPVLIFYTDQGMSESETQLINMAFGDESQVALSDLFSDYVTDKNWIKQKSAKTSSDERRIRKQGQELVDRYKDNLNRISDLVTNESVLSGKNNYYRALSGSEKAFFWRIGALTVINLLLTIGVFGYFLFSFDDFHWHLLIIAVLSVVAIVMIVSIAGPYFRDGVLTEEGAEVYQFWQAFRNMVTELKTFDKAELESIILWNRLLVYATLFGQAKAVSKVLKINHIHLPNPDLDHFVYHGHFNTMTNRVGLMSTSASTAVQDSNFSISSNSSSGGGFSGGGFSGGGGGGGGGSF